MISTEAERFGIDVPIGRLDESQVSSFEGEVSERLVLIGELEKLHPTKLIPVGTFGWVVHLSRVVIVIVMSVLATR